MSGRPPASPLVMETQSRLQDSEHRCQPRVGGSSQWGGWLVHWPGGKAAWGLRRKVCASSPGAGTGALAHRKWSHRAPWCSPACHLPPCARPLLPPSRAPAGPCSEARSFRNLKPRQGRRAEVSHRQCTLSLRITHSLWQEDPYPSTGVFRLKDCG